MDFFLTFNESYFKLIKLLFIKNIMRTFKRAKTLADIPKELNISLPSFSIENSDDVKSLLSDLSSTHSEKIQIIFENNLNDEENLDNFIEDEIVKKRDARKKFPEEMKVLSQNFMDELMKDYESKKNSKAEKEDNDTKLGTYINAYTKTPTASAGFNESTIRLKNDLKGDATYLNPDNYTVTNENDRNDTERSKH